MTIFRLTGEVEIPEGYRMLMPTEYVEAGDMIFNGTRFLCVVTFVGTTLGSESLYPIRAECFKCAIREVSDDTVQT